MIPLDEIGIQRADSEGGEREGLPSASGLDAEIRCPGRRNLVGNEKQSESKAAQRGTKIHEVLAGSVPLGSIPESDHWTIQRIMFEECRLVDGELIPGFELHGADCLRESEEKGRLWLSNDNLDRVFSAKPDCIYVKTVGKKKIVVDVNYKTGYSRTVPISRNWQIKSETVLAALQHGADAAVGLLIHPHHPDSLSEVLAFNAETLHENEQRILAAVEEFKNPDAPRTPNGISCAYCPARKRCPEYQHHIAPILSGKTSDWSALSKEEKADKLRLNKLVVRQIEHEEDLAKADLKANPEAVPGWKLRPSSRRVFKDQEAAKSALRNRYGDDAEKAIEVSLTKSEALIIEREHVSKKEAFNAMVKIFGTSIQKDEKEPSLVEGE